LDPNSIQNAAREVADDLGYIGVGFGGALCVVAQENCGIMTAASRYIAIAAEEATILNGRLDFGADQAKPQGSGQQ
jgi:hypothetical protein